MSNVSDQINSELSDWLGDIVALESHVEEAMDGQLKIDGDASLTGVIQHLHDTVRDSKHRAETFQAEYGSTAGNPVIKKGAELLGKAAGQIGKMRNDSVAKALRDDYVAYNQLAISYTMLHTTAMALQDARVQQFAETGLRTYAGLVQKINSVIPDAVVADIEKGDHAPASTAGVADGCREFIDSVWKQTSN